MAFNLRFLVLKISCMKHLLSTMVIMMMSASWLSLLMLTSYWRLLMMSTLWLLLLMVSALWLVLLNRRLKSVKKNVKLVLINKIAVIKPVADE